MGIRTITIALALGLTAPTLTRAAHPRSSGAHTYTMHSADMFSDEDYCSDDVSAGGVLGDANVAGYMSDA